MILQPRKKIEISEQKKQQQEFQFLGSGIKRKGLKLFAFDPDKQICYPVDVEKKKNFNIIKKASQSSHKAMINKKHHHIWALNEKTALKKFKKHFANINQNNNHA